jgi:hypothetical protein
VLSFSLTSRNFLISSFISSMTHCSLSNELFSFQLFACFLPLLLLLSSSFIALWSDRMHSIISMFLYLLKLALCPRIWSILEKVPWAPSPFLWCVFSRVSWTICPCWLQTLILLNSASWVASFTGMSHWYLARYHSFLNILWFLGPLLLIMIFLNYVVVWKWSNHIRELGAIT